MRNFKIPLVHFRPKVFGLFVSPNFFTGDTIMLHNDEPMNLVQYDYTVYFYLLSFFLKKRVNLLQQEARSSTVVQPGS